MTEKFSSKAIIKYNNTETVIYICVYELNANSYNHVLKYIFNMYFFDKRMKMKN